MSSNLNWAGLNAGSTNSGGGQGNSSGAIMLLVLVGGLCCCLLVCGLGLWYAHSQGWLDNLFKKEEEAPAPEEGDPDPTEPEDPAPSGDSVNNTGKSHVCARPWERAVVKYDKDGMNPKCCTAEDAGYQWNNCQAGDVLEVPKDLSVADVHSNAQRIKKKFVQGGKLNRGKCPSAALGESIWWKEINGSGAVQQAWCAPFNKKRIGTKVYEKGKLYPLYPACLKNPITGEAADSNTIKADKNASNCEGTGAGKGFGVLWRPKEDPVFKSGGQHKYVVGGGNK